MSRLHPTAACPRGLCRRNSDPRQDHRCVAAGGSLYSSSDLAIRIEHHVEGDAMSKETTLSAKASMQGDLWGRHPELWAKHIEPQERRWFEATMDALEPLADVPLVDVGCGSGVGPATPRGGGW